MNNQLLIVILSVGFSGLVAQILILRELLVSFYGNELTLGVSLASWVICEALGVLCVGKLSDKIKNKINLFVILQFLFCAALFWSIYFARTFKGLLGIPFGSAIGLGQILMAALLITLPLAFAHGGIFSLACSILAQQSANEEGAIGKIYAWETIGTIIGGLAITYLLIPRLGTFEIVFLTVLLNQVICFFFFKRILLFFRCALALMILLSLGLFFGNAIEKLELYSLSREYKSAQVLETRNSIYGNLTVVKREKQYSFYYNGLPVITTPYPDITFVQEFGSFPLLFHSCPKSVLVLSAGSGGLIHQLLDFPIQRLDYAEIDPLLIALVKKYPTALTSKEFSDSRVRVINTDSRFFIRTTAEFYDLVLIGLSNPWDLNINRLFTQEFFGLVKKRLNPQGIVSLWLPGSLTYLGPELKKLNACVLNALQENFAYIRVIPGDYNILLASDDKQIMSQDAQIISRKISDYNLHDTILVPNYLRYRLDPKWDEWFSASMKGVSAKTNLDLRPAALFYTLSLWNKQFSPLIFSLYNTFGKLSIWHVFFLIFILTFVLWIILKGRKRKPDLSIAYAVLTTGFFGMLSSLVLIFVFQVFYGYLYYKIGLFISIFMSGIALGSMILTRYMRKLKGKAGVFIKLELVILLFTLILSGIITVIGAVNYLSLILSALLFICGFLVGLEFPLASKLYIDYGHRVGEAAGVLYFADLAGGCIAGFFAGIVFLPILGLFNTCLIMAFLKFSSLILLLLCRPKT